MNILKFEIKKNLKSFIIWNVCIFAFLTLVITKYTGFADDGSTVSALLDSFPKQFLAMFGMGRVDISTLSGYFSVVYDYMLIILGIYAILLGYKTIIGENEDKTYEFIYTRPVSRYKILVIKMATALLELLVTMLLIYLCINISLKIYDIDNTLGKGLFVALNGMFVFSLIFFSLTILLCAAIKTKRIRNLAIYGMFFLTYFIGVIYELVPDTKILRIFTPFKYCDSLEIVNGNINIYLLLVSYMIIGLSLFFGFKLFNESDLKDM